MNYFPFHVGDYAAHTAHLEPMEDLAYRRLLDAYYLHEKALPVDLAEVARLIRMRPYLDVIKAVLGEFFTLSADGWHNKRADAELTGMLAKQAQRSTKDEHEVERMRRHRERRAQVFAMLRERGVVPPWDVSMKELQRLFDGACNGPATDLQREQVGACNADATAIPIPTPTPNTKEEKELSATPHPAEAGIALLKFPPGFERFWSAYPRKIGKDAAAKAFARRKPTAELVDQMIRAIAEQAKGEQWRKDGGQFIPHPSTWLNEGRWLDETGVGPAIDPGLADMFRRGQA